LERQTYNGTEDVRVSLDLIQDGAKRLSRLAEQTVLYAQILSGYIDQRVATSSEVLEVSYLLDSALAILGELTRNRNIIFQQDVATMINLACMALGIFW